MTIEIQDHAFSDPVPLLLDNGNSGFIYSLLQTAEDDSYDLEEPFRPQSGLWDFDEISRKPINLQTGNEINGRQDFPEVFEHEGTLTILKKDSLANLERLIMDGCADGFIMSDADSIQINTEIDMLRCMVLLRTRAEC
jgi:hypothetical protein